MSESVRMPTGNDDSRLVAACTNCAAVFAAVAVSDGRIQPIGSRNGCPSCDNAEYTRVAGSGERVDAPAVVFDD